MANINNVLLEFANRLLDVKNGKENPTLGELIDTPKAQLIEYFMGIVGEDEALPTEQDLIEYLPKLERDQLRNEIRSRLEKE